MRRKRRRIAAYVVAGVVTIVVSGGLKLWLEKCYVSSVRKGAEWILGQEDKLSPRDSVNYLTKIYKVTKDEELALKLRQGIERARARIEPEPIHVTIIEKAKIDWEGEVMPVLVELGRQKCRGNDVEAEIGEVGKVIKEREGELFDGLPGVEKVIGAYFMREVGLEVPPILNNASCATNLNEREDIYCLTHRVIIDSDYYQRKVDSRKYRNEEKLLKAAILKNWWKMQETRWLDVVAQSYVALKLMQEGEGFGFVKARILGLQNQDGSWGDGEIESSQKIHATTISILALSDFRSEFKQDKLFCY